MGILGRIFNKEKNEYEEADILSVLTNGIDGKDYIQTMAEAKAINLIAKTISKTTLKIYSYDKKEKKIKRCNNEVDFRLNIKPNFNDTGTSFLYKLALKLLIDKHVLIVKNKYKKEPDLLFIADSFSPNSNVLREKNYNNVMISDNEGNSIELKKTLYSDDYIYISFNNSKINSASENFTKNIKELAGIIIKKYKISNIQKWLLKRPGQNPVLTDYKTGKEITYEEYTERITNGLLSDEDAVVLLSNMFDLLNLNKDNTQSLSDYKDIFKTIGNSAAQKYDIPLDIYWGEKTEKSTGNDDFITFALDPYYECIEDAFNDKLIGLEGYKNGERILFDRLSLFHHDILDSANGIDKLISSTFTRNEINEFLKLPNIDEKWADEPILTKNYGKVKGGVEDE